MHQDEIVNVPAAVPDAEFFFDEFVERVEVEVREHLAREVADGKPCAVGSEKQALRPGKPDPAMSVAFYDAVSRSDRCRARHGRGTGGFRNGRPGIFAR